MKIQAINKFYSTQSETVHALKDVSIDFIHSGIVFIMGESGSGKSTLLRILAGADTDYTGSIEIEESPYYVSSDYDLFDELTVYENLALTRKRKKTILRYLKHFNLSDVTYSKAKLLSNGEKRRVQLVKAILMDKRIILLDETISALDHDNLICIMDLLKSIRNDHLIILITHNETLIEPYADQIIRLHDGRLVEQKTIHEVNPTGPTHIILHVNHSKDTAKALYAYIKQLHGYIMAFILLALLTVITTTITIDLFTSTSTNSTHKQTIESNNATLTAIPLEPSYSSSNPYGVYQSVYDQYDSFYYQDILDLIHENTDIIAINPTYSFRFSDSLPTTDTTNDYYLIRDRTKYENNYPSYDGMINTGPINGPNYIISEAYYMDQDDCDTFACSKYFHSIDQDSQVIMNKVNVFTLVNDYTDVIKLLYGEFGSASNELVIDYSFATKLMALYQVDSYEQLLGQPLILNVVRASNAYAFERNYASEDLLFDPTTLDEKYIHDPYESVSFTISGISEYDNTSQNNAYLCGSILDNPLLSTFLSDNDHHDLPFRTINIMVKPDQDMDQMKKDLNAFFHLDQSEFVLVSELEMVKSFDESYKINTPTIIIAALITVISIVALAFLFFKTKTKIGKTIALLDDLNYKRNYIWITQTIVFMIIMVLSLIVSSLLQVILNTYSIDFQLAQLIQLNYGLIMIISLVVSWIPMVMIQANKINMGNPSTINNHHA